MSSTSSPGPALDLEGIEDVHPDFLDHFREVAGGRHLGCGRRIPSSRARVEAAGLDGQIGP